MARNRVTIDFKGFDDYMEKMDKLGGTDLMKKGVEDGLRASKQYINDELKKVSTSSKYPAKGKYSQGLTKDSIDENLKIEWKGLVGYIKIGYNFNISGLRTIMLMYGTPKMQPVKGMKSAVYGSKTKKNIAELQKQAIDKLIERYMK